MHATYNLENFSIIAFISQLVNITLPMMPFNFPVRWRSFFTAALSAFARGNRNHSDDKVAIIAAVLSEVW